MSCLAYHHDSYYFQIRVPAALVARFGPIVRTHLQTKDRAEEKLLALRLASDWLARFHVEQRTAGAAGPVQEGLVRHRVDVSGYRDKLLRIRSSRPANAFGCSSLIPLPWHNA